MSIQNAPPAVDTGARPITIQSAQKGLLVFAGFLIPLSLFGYWFYINFSDLPLTLPSLPLALCPGLACILTRLVRREGFADVSFRWHGRQMGRSVLVAIGLPLVVGTLAYGAAFLFGLARFNPPPFPVAASSPAAQFALNLLFAATLGFLLVLPSTSGEEIGWRGYLLPRLVDARLGSRLPQPVLLTALIWAAWHLPVVLAGVYAAGSSPFISSVLLVLAATQVGLIIGWIRLSTGSIWPCILSHAAWNALINGGFTPAAQESAGRLWTGETGILAVVVLVPAVFLVRRALRIGSTERAWKLDGA
jgi:uncharacterized protein